MSKPFVMPEFGTKEKFLLEVARSGITDNSIHRDVLDTIMGGFGVDVDYSSVKIKEGPLHKKDILFVRNALKAHFKEKGISVHSTDKASFFIFDTITIVAYPWTGEQTTYTERVVGRVDISDIFSTQKAYQIVIVSDKTDHERLTSLINEALEEHTISAE